MVFFYTEGGFAAMREKGKHQGGKGMKRKVFAAMYLAMLILAATGCGTKGKAADGEKMKFTYSSWVSDEQKNVFSTVDKVIQKDLVTDKVASAEWEISAETEAAVAELFRKYDAAGLAERQKQYAKSSEDSETVTMTFPTSYAELTFVWDGAEYAIPATTKDSLMPELKAFYEELEELLRKEAAYRSLPEAKGGYQ